ncbi:MAG: transglutaminase-like domain-containing protein [Armatimonadota bacterium]
MRRAVKIVVPLLALCAVLAVAWGAMMLESPVTSEELDQLVGTDWYSVSIYGQPNGYARIEGALVDDGAEGGPRLRVSEDLRVVIRLAGNELEASKSQVTVYDEQLRPISIEMEKNELGRSARLSARLEDGAMVVRTDSAEPGAPDEAVKRLELPDDFASDVLISVRALRGQLSPGDSFTYAVYDPEVDVIDSREVSVDRREAIGETEALVVEAKSAKLGISVVSWIDDEGKLLRQTVPGLMDLTLERVSEEEALASLVPFEVNNTIEVAEHLPLVRSLREITLRVTRNIGPAEELLTQTHRQSIVSDGDDAIVTISREHPPAETLPLPITGESMEQYLRPTTHVQSDDPRIVETAREIVGDETDSWGAAQKLCAWVKRNMHAVSSEPRPITALEVLDSMRGDCTEHAILMAALGRAVGLPTKLVTGLAYVGGSFGYHAWTEVYVGRWVEMDPSWGEMTVDAGHLQIFASSLDEASYARASLATGRTIGAIGMQVEQYTTADGRTVRPGEEQ